MTLHVDSPTYSPFGPRNSNGSLLLASAPCTILSYGCTTSRTHLCHGLFAIKPSSNYSNLSMPSVSCWDLN